MSNNEHRPGKVRFYIDLDAQLARRLERWRAKQPGTPSKTGITEAALREFLDRQEKRA